MMILEQYYLGCLSHASYLVGDTVSGRAAVIDPQRDVSQYLVDAQRHGLNIDTVIETHFHADFLSGHLELAEATGARIVYGRAADGRAQYPIHALDDGAVLAVGDPVTGVTLEIRETPGHTPESICVVVRERGDAEPYAVFTGDTLFIGDVGRPDLLVAVGFDAGDLARQLYRSLHDRLLTLPDATLVYPAHGAGSACGKNLSTETVSTIGEQRRTNYALAPMSEDEFVARVTEGQPAAPMYFLHAAVGNQRDRARLDESADLRMLSLDDVLAQQAAGAAVVDTRDDLAFAAGHLHGSINVGLGGRFAEYTGEVVQPGTPIVLVGDPGTEHEAVVRLARIGFDSVVGSLADPLRAFVERPDLVESSSRLTASEFDTRRLELADLQLVDVRGPGEVADGIVPGATVIQLPELVRRWTELDPNRPIVVYCAGGYRSSIAASTLRSLGCTDVSDLLGGYNAWRTLEVSA